MGQDNINPEPNSDYDPQRREFLQKLAILPVALGLSSLSQDGSLDIAEQPVDLEEIDENMFESIYEPEKILMPEYETALRNACKLSFESYSQDISKVFSREKFGGEGNIEETFVSNVEHFISVMKRYAGYLEELKKDKDYPNVALKEIINQDYKEVASVAHCILLFGNVRSKCNSSQFRSLLQDFQMHTSVDTLSQDNSELQKIRTQIQGTWNYDWRSLCKNKSTGNPVLEVLMTGLPKSTGLLLDRQLATNLISLSPVVADLENDSSRPKKTERINFSAEEFTYIVYYLKKLGLDRAVSRMRLEEGNERYYYTTISSEINLSLPSKELLQDALTELLFIEIILHEHYHGLSERANTTKHPINFELRRIEMRCVDRLSALNSDNYLNFSQKGEELTKFYSPGTNNINRYFYETLMNEHDSYDWGAADIPEEFFDVAGVLLGENYKRLMFTTGETMPTFLKRLEEEFDGMPTMMQIFVSEILKQKMDILHFEPKEYQWNLSKGGISEERYCNTLVLPLTMAKIIFSADDESSPLGSYLKNGGNDHRFKLFANYCKSLKRRLTNHTYSGPASEEFLADMFGYSLLPYVDYGFEPGERNADFRNTKEDMLKYIGILRGEGLA